MSMDSFQLSRRTMLRGMGIGAAAIGGGALLAACTPGGSSNTASDELLIGTTLAPEGDALKEAQKYTGDPIGVKLKYQTLQGDNIASQLAAMQQVKRLPDVILVSAGYVSTMLAAGLRLEPLEGYAASGEDTSDFYDADFASASVDGHLYMSNFSVSCRTIAYRSDLAEAGGAGTPPETWDGDTFGKFAKAMTTPDIAGFGWEAKTGDPRAPSNWIPLLWSTGAEVVKGTAGKWETGFTADQFATLMQFYSDMIFKHGATPTDVGGWGYPETDGGFNKGVLASYSSGPFVRSIVAQTPEVNDTLAAAPLPNLGTPSNFFEGFGYSIFADSTRKDKAYEFTQLMRSQEQQDRMMTREGNAGSGIRRSSNAKIADPYVAFFPSQFDIARPQDPIDIQPINNSVVMPAMQRIALERANPRDVAAEAITAMDAILEQLNGA